MSEHLPASGEWLQTGIGTSSADAITVCGRDLTRELMGKVSFTELTFLMLMGRSATAGEAAMLDAVLVSLADHGLTPTVLAARLTYAGAPDSLQGAVASGLLGSGSVLLGVTEDAAAFLDTILKDLSDRSDAAMEAAAEEIVQQALTDGRRIPGLGHHIHRREDPRVQRLYEIAQANRVLGDHMRLLLIVARSYAQQRGKPLPVNGAGAAGAALADLGIPHRILRGISMLARTAGLVAQVNEEMAHPIGMRLYQEVDSAAVYRPPLWRGSTE